MNTSFQNNNLISTLLTEIFPQNNRQQTICLSRLEEAKLQIINSTDKLFSLFKSIFLTRVNNTDSLPEIIVLTALLGCSIEFKGFNEYLNPVTKFSKYDMTIVLILDYTDQIKIENIDSISRISIATKGKIIKRLMIWTYKKAAFFDIWAVNIQKPVAAAHF